MIGLLATLETVFDKLYQYTSNEIVEDRPYAASRSREGLYAITNTQSGESTFAADEFEHEQINADAPQRQGGQSTESFDCEDPSTCPTCTPRTVSTD